MSSYEDALRLINGGTEAPEDRMFKRDQREIAAAGREFIQRNSQDGITLDTQSGLPGGMRAKMSFEPDLKRQAEWLAKQPGILGVRTADDGESLIARIQGASGARDVLVDERKITLRDLAEMSGDAPEAAAALALAYGTGGMSLLGQTAMVTGGTALTRVHKNMVARELMGTDQSQDTIGTVAQEQAVPMMMDAGIPLAGAAGKKILQSLVGPFARSAGPLEREALKAAERLDIPLSAGQRTGSGFLSRAEAFSARLPGGGALKDQKAAQDEAIRRVQQMLLGGSADDVASSQSIADRAGKALAGSKSEIEARAAGRREQAAELAQANVRGLIDAQTLPGNIPASDAGALVRQKVGALRDGFRSQSQALYDEVYNAAGGAAVLVPTKPMADVIADIRKNSSAAAQTLMPEIKRLFAIGDKLPNAMPLRQAVELRALLNDSIARGEPIGGIGDRYAKQLAKSITASIERGVHEAPNKSLGKAFAKANSYYRDNVARFEQRGITELFADPTQIDDAKLVKRIFDGGDADLLSRYENVLGATSNEYRAILKAGTQRMIERATPMGERFIDAGSLLSSLRGMEPEVRKKLLGSAEKDIVANAKLLELARGAKIEAAEAEKILTGAPGLAAETLRNAIGRQKNIDRYYKKKILVDLMDGQMSPAQLNADEFVTRFVRDASAKDVRQVLTMLGAKGSPELVEDIRKRTLVDILNQAGKSVTPDDAVGDRLGDLAYDKLDGFLRNEGEKLTAVLGKETMGTLRDLTKVMAVRAKGDNAAGRAGQLVESGIFASMMKGEIKQLPLIVKNRIVASLLTKPGVKTMLGSGVVLPETPRARMALFASPPVIRAIMEEFSEEPDKLGQVLDAVQMGPDATETRTDARRFERALELVTPEK